MFEKLGWLVLAYREGDIAAVTHYKRGLNHLKDALEAKIKTTHDRDRKDDLVILHGNVLSLISHVSNEFKPKK